MINAGRSNKLLGAPKKDYPLKSHTAEHNAETTPITCKL
jgi:hypothetical protein